MSLFRKRYLGVSCAGTSGRWGGETVPSPHAPPSSHLPRTPNPPWGKLRHGVASECPSVPPLPALLTLKAQPPDQQHDANCKEDGEEADAEHRPQHLGRKMRPPRVPAPRWHAGTVALGVCGQVNSPSVVLSSRAASPKAWGRVCIPRSTGTSWCPLGCAWGRCPQWRGDKLVFPGE